MKIKLYIFLLLLMVAINQTTAMVALDNDIVSTSIIENTTSQDTKAEFDDFPNLHPLVVHFPIALLLLAFVLQLIQLFTLNRTMDWVILLTLGVGFIGA